MGRDDKLRGQYPMVFAFGSDPIGYLTHEESVAAPVADRIRSVWPFLVRQVLRFAATLRPRDLVNYDVEDVLGELWVALTEKDAKWDPGRGRYLTFAGRVVTNELHAIRDRSHTVHAPRNTSCRLKQYAAEDDAGSLSPVRRKTYDDILRVLGEREAVDEDPAALSAPGAADEAERREETEHARAAVKAGFGALTPNESLVVGQAYGLFDGRAADAAEIAAARRVTVETVKRVMSRALKKVRKRVEESGIYTGGPCPQQTTNSPPGPGARRTPTPRATT